MQTPPLPSFFSGKGKRKSRHGISPVIATTIILAITIVLGLTLWSFANSGVGTATTKYSEAVNEYGETVRYHRFVIANVDFNNPNSDQVAIWIYNNGKLNATMSDGHVIITCKDCPPLSPFDPTETIPLTQESPEYPSDPLTVPPKTLHKFYFGITKLDPGKIYEITIVSDEGLTQTYVKKMD